MELINYKEFIAQRKAKAESQAREYFYNKKERKPYYWAEGNTLTELEDYCQAELINDKSHRTVGFKL